jgi:hypothetical protein
LAADKKLAFKVQVAPQLAFWPSRRPTLDPSSDQSRR